MGNTGRLLFMAAVTSFLLSRLFAADPTAFEVLVYAATAAVGLEFLLASWRDLWEPG